MKQRIRVAVMAVTLCAVMVLSAGCGKKFDASGYVKACLDLVTKNEQEDYMKLTERTKEQAEEDYQSNLDTIMSDFAALGISDELQDKYRAFYADILKSTKYTVLEAKEDGDNFTVDVEVEQLTGVFNGVQDELVTAAQEYAEGLTEQPTNEEANEWTANKLYEILMERMSSSLTYNEKKTITVHVQLNDKIYEIPQSDYDALDAALIDVGDLG